MKLGLALFGALLGVFFAHSGRFLFGATIGLAIGVIVAQIRDLLARIEVLETRQRSQAAATQRMAPPPPPPATPATPSPSAPPTPATPAPPGQPDHKIPEQQPAKPKTAYPTWPPEPEPQPQITHEGIHYEPPPPPAPTHVERLFEMVKNWFTTGNVPVKVGVVVSFFGVGFLLKYSVDRELIVIPIELRLTGVAVVAMGLLAFGWRLYKRLPVYGLSLQGGGIGMLYLTIFAAFRLYSLLPPLFAFSLLVGLTAAAGALALLQNAKALAVLGIVGGFMAPVLISTGSGNHVALFSYYLVLNLAILVIARFRAWRELNVLGFAFTFVIGTGWGYKYYRPELFASTEPFLVLHFLLYQAVAVLFALRHAPNLKGVVDGTIVFGTPVVAFALQAALLKDTEYGLAISAVVVALFYTGLASWLWSKHRQRLRLLTESYLGLAVAFATIAIPLALDARWTAAAWALEGAALVWVGMRQGTLLAKATGSLLLFAAGVSFVLHGWDNDAGFPILNGNFLGGLLIAAASLAAARFFDALQKPRPRWHGVPAPALFAWGTLWWLGTGVAEIDDRVPDDHAAQALTLFIALSGLSCTLFATWKQWAMARRATLLHLPLLILTAAACLFTTEHPFATWGGLAWVMAAGVQLKILSDYEERAELLVAVGHSLGVLFAACLLMWEAAWRADHAGVNQTWVLTAAGMVPVLMAVATMASRDRVTWPIKRHWQAFFATAGILLIGALLYVGAAVVANPGNPKPLTYLPVANPFDIATLLTLGAAFMWVVRANHETPWFDGGLKRFIVVALPFVAFVLTTIAVVRGVHHWMDVPWRPNRLFESVAVQAALSIYWGLLGVAGMVWGAQSSRRTLWLVGAGLMGLVVVKLFIIDLGNTETIARIVSFIGVGALLLLVGYFAPVPPRGSTDNIEANEDAS